MFGMVEKAFTLLFLFFLLFSNLLSRISGLSLNFAPYAAAGVLLIFTCFRIGWNALAIVTAAACAFFLIFVFDPRAQVVYNLLALKDFVLPVACLLLGMRLLDGTPRGLDMLNWLYLPFIGYGVLQEQIFLSGDFATALPWDDAWVKKMIEDHIWNIYQGPILRFFGAMNAYNEYQIFVAVICVFLWQRAGVIRNRILLVLNMGLSLFFLGVSLERAPIVMMIVVLAVWRGGLLLRSAPKTAFAILASVLLLLGVVAAGMTELEISPKFQVAYQRLENVLTMRFGEDEALQSRQDTEWREAIDEAREHPMGIGPARVAPSASEYDLYIGPHNNYLLLFMAYGILGVAVVGVLLVMIIRQCLMLEISSLYFSMGLTISYLLMAIFNIPFHGKTGVLYFLITGILIAGGRGDDEAGTICGSTGVLSDKCGKVVPESDVAETERVLSA
jgi:O-antigen ligase